MKIILLTLSLIFFCSPLSAKICTDQNNKNTAFSQLQLRINSMINTLSKTKIIATEADYFLSRLIKGQSPIILNWIKKRGFNPQKEANKIAIEWRKYYLNEFVIRRYPHKSAKVNELINKLFIDINNITFSQNKKLYFQKLFLLAKKNALKKINQLKIKAPIKQKILKRIEGIQIHWFSKLPGSKFEKMPKEFINWGIAYDPVPNEINMGIEALKYKNDETIYAVFAHELAHSIDPCRWSVFIQEKNPFTKIYQCLRSKNSAHALKRDDSQMKSMLNNKKISKEFALVLKQNPNCNKSFYPPMGIQKDQLSETFADWFSAELVSMVPKYITYDLRSDLSCERNKLQQGSSYISNIKRLEAIYYAHPNLQKKLKIKSKYKYCRVD